MWTPAERKQCVAQLRNLLWGCSQSGTWRDSGGSHLNSCSTCRKWFPRLLGKGCILHQTQIGIKADAQPKENEMVEDYVRGTDDNLLPANFCKQARSARLLQHNAYQLSDGASTRQVGLHCSLFPSSGSDLSYHEGVHGNERFTCGYCKKVFKKRGTLTVHLRVHTGEKPFQCHLCPRNFTQRATLMYHMRTHTGEKPYQCRYCPRAFSRKMLQKNHERSKHLKHLTTL
ncbi:zinc finger protein 586-like isoform X2 [Dermacentor albipictus]|uniref:zinc finger protein 586-like isoform X2 n=1 Tax=Dermacentor albipictus TaxID=60249 RepID=UPI0031FC7AA7